MEKTRSLLIFVASIIVLTLAIAPLPAQAQMNGSKGCGHMDSMGYGPTAPSVQTAPYAGWAAQLGAYEHVSPQHVHVKSSKRLSKAKKPDHQAQSGSAAAEPANHTGHALEHVNQTGPPPM